MVLWPIYNDQQVHSMVPSPCYDIRAMAWFGRLLVRGFHWWNGPSAHLFTDLLRVANLEVTGDDITVKYHYHCNCSCSTEAVTTEVSVGSAALHKIIHNIGKLR